MNFKYKRISEGLKLTKLSLLAVIEIATHETWHITHVSVMYGNSIVYLLFNKFDLDLEDTAATQPTGVDYEIVSLTGTVSSV